jgi:hypothetical protein
MSTGSINVIGTLFVVQCVNIGERLAHFMQILAGFLENPVRMLV